MFKTKSAGLVHYYNENHKITPRKILIYRLRSSVALSVIYYLKKISFILKTVSFYTVGVPSRIVLFEGFKALIRIQINKHLKINDLKSSKLDHGKKNIYARVFANNMDKNRIGR